MISNKHIRRGIDKTSNTRCSFGRHNSVENLDIHTGSQNIFGDIDPSNQLLVG